MQTDVQVPQPVMSTVPESTAPIVEPSFFERVKSTVQGWFQDLSVSRIVELLAYFGIGFFLGFLLKRYCRYVLIAFVALIVAAIVLQSFGFIAINWKSVQSFFGIYPHDTIGSISTSLITWIKEHILVVISSILGFIIGYTVG